MKCLTFFEIQIDIPLEETEEILGEKEKVVAISSGLINFQAENQPKIKLFDFGAFQINMHMASREKYIFHMLFGAFHITSSII